MLKIAICDNEIIFLNILRNIISEYLEDKKLRYVIDIFFVWKRICF